ncbi:DegT/DnrJ/EryC1/StrS family aminotransferase [Catenuloplanes japonicus]|uniref:DegT/DnrJ/EryC1/StrS family aminotransferase n=1 Tax=Catenuloplanes japonicus TaxID=33876 RepID=UPI000527D16B|nr:DegT/DnrJ/EryC1/StrS family aminotransferase [Catenuloplanes japonicus]
MKIQSTRAPVPFFSQRATFEALWPRIADGLDEVLDGGKFSHGRAVAALEADLAAWTGARHVIGVNSGTDALVLLLRAAGLRPGDEVVVPAFSFVASASAVVLAGGRPRFADIDPETYALDPAAASAAVTGRTRMLMPVHLFSRMADMDALGAVAGAHDLRIVEDSAEAIGMRHRGTHAGLLGAGGVLSFFPSKTLGAIGDAGAVLTDDPYIAETVAALRHHGRPGPSLHNFPAIATASALPGTNSKMDDLQAEVLRAKLGRLDADIARRAALAEAYTARLTGAPGIRKVPTGSVFYVYLIEADDRDGLAAHLAARGIGTEVYYPRPLHLQPCFADLGHRAGDFPHAEAACARTLALPLYPDLADGDVGVVCDAIDDFYRGGNR